MSIFISKMLVIQFPLSISFMPFGLNLDLFYYFYAIISGIILFHFLDCSLKDTQLGFVYQSCILRSFTKLLIN